MYFFSHIFLLNTPYFPLRQADNHLYTNSEKPLCCNEFDEHLFCQRKTSKDADFDTMGINVSVLDFCLKML